LIVVYCFRRLGGEDVNLLELHICVGDYVVIGTEMGHFGLGMGVVHDLREKNVRVLIKDPLRVFSSFRCVSLVLSID
jgi:hypothetical protein